MATIGLFYGSEEGHTEDVAGKIKNQFPANEVEVHDIADASPDDFTGFSKLILGTPTWENGGKQSDWEGFWSNLYEIDFSNKKVALFGLGDQIGYADYFLDAMGDLNDTVISQGGTIVGQWSTEGYDFSASRALAVDGVHFVGLAIDEDTQDDMTDERVETWVKQIQAELA